MVPGMEFQNQVRQSLLADFTRLQRLLANEVFARRSEVADRVCEAFGFRDGRGRLQRAGCLKALAEFEAAVRCRCRRAAVRNLRNVLRSRFHAACRRRSGRP